MTSMERHFLTAMDLSCPSNVISNFSPGWRQGCYYAFPRILTILSGLSVCLCTVYSPFCLDCLYAGAIAGVKCLQGGHQCADM